MQIGIRALAGFEADDFSSKPATITKINPGPERLARRNCMRGLLVFLAYSILRNDQLIESAAPPRRIRDTGRVQFV